MKKKTTFMLKILSVLVGCLIIAGIWIICDNGKDEFEKPVSPSLQPDAAPPAERQSSPIHELQKTDLRPPAESAGSFPAIDFSYLRLIGTAMGDHNPYAIILNEKIKAQGIFRVGDVVGGAFVKHILADKVILQYEDRLFTLIMMSGGDGEIGDVAEVAPGKDSNPPIHALSDQAQGEIETAWAETQELMRQIELTQYMEGTEPQGVTVVTVAPDSVFDTIGFQPGDVVLAVDDMEISIADDAMEIYNCLRTKSEVQFTVKRHGETVVLTYHQPDAGEQ